MNIIARAWLWYLGTGFRRLSFTNQSVSGLAHKMVLDAIYSQNDNEDKWLDLRECCSGGRLDNSSGSRRRYCTTALEELVNGNKAWGREESLVDISVANPCVVQDSRCIHILLILTSVYAEYSYIQVISRLTNPIRKDVSAKWPNWLLEGVVTAIHLREVIHLRVAPEGVAHCRCRWRFVYPE
jgi:hypothetical protein